MMEKYQGKRYLISLDNQYEIKSTTKQVKYKILVGMLEKANVPNISKKMMLLSWYFGI